MYRKALEYKKLYTEEDRQQGLAAMPFDSTIERLAVLKAERDAILAPRVGTMTNELLSDVAGAGWNTGSAMALSSTSLLSASKSKILDRRFRLQMRMWQKRPRSQSSKKQRSYRW
jgi:hypothetical protein